MEQRSKLSDVINNVLYDRHPKNFYDLDIKTVAQKSYKKIYDTEEERQILQLNFGNTPEKLRGDYLDK